MEQLKFDLEEKNFFNSRKYSDVKEKVSCDFSIFSPKQYDTEFFYYTEIISEWVQLKK